MKRWIAYLSLVACGEVKNKDVEPDAPEVPPDTPIEPDGPTGCSPTQAFAAHPIVAEVSSASREETVSLPGNELEMFIVRLGEGTFRSRRASMATEWSTPVRIDALGDVGIHTVTLDGLTAYVTFDGGANGSQIGIATRATTDEEFGIVSPLANINSASTELWPMTDATGKALYFVSDRDGTSRLYRAVRTSTTMPFGSPEVVDAPAGVFSPVITDGELGLYYSLIDGTGKFELYYSSRASVDEGFPAGTKFPELTPVAGGWPGFVSQDHCRVYFMNEAEGGLGSLDVHLATREPE